MYTLADMVVWMMILTRIVGIFLIAPVFSHSSIPLIAKITLAAAFATIAFPLAQVEVAYPSSLTALILWTAKELIVGVTIGLAMRMLFFVLDFASHVLTVEIGLMPGPEFDPSSAGNQSNPLGTIIYFFGLMLLLHGSEYDILRAFMMSFEVAPLGFMQTNAYAGEFIIESTAGIFKVGILMAAPVVAVNFLVNLVFATLGKVVPKLNVFILSFSARIFIGTTVLAASVTLIAHYAMNYLEETPEMMLRFILFRPEY